MPSSPLRILILSPQQDWGEAFVEAVSPPSEAGVAEVVVEGDRFVLRICDRIPDAADDRRTLLSDISAVLLQVRFLDAKSLEELRSATRALAPERLPLAVFLVREEGEVDFKISCRDCGQKLWVRDSDEGKRGRCPNCRKAFPLPSQAGHVRQEMGLPDVVPITRIIHGSSASCRNALAEVKSHLIGGWVDEGEAVDPEALLKKTVRVELTSLGDETHGGEGREKRSEQ
jgi:hypothetical protein